MDFYIQTSNPRYNNILNKEDKQLSEAIESVFPMNTESAFIVWNHIYIPLSYKYDISYMIEDIMRIIDSIQRKNLGKLNVRWLPDTFRTDWDIEWDGEHICIISQWEHTVGCLEKLLNKENKIIIKKRDFVYEWKELLSVLIRGLLHCGYDKKTILGMEDIIKLYNSIEESGCIYK